LKGPNRYALLGRLATGGMAELFLARSTADDAIVVLKRVKPAKLDDPRFVAMFLDEARVMASLRHPNIARVFDIGRFGASYFFTMEYVHGEDMRSVMSRLAELRRALPIGHALHVAAATGAGLHHAHECTGPDGAPLGIVHRDVSPANLMVGFDGAIKVIDFGIAKATIVKSKTKTGAVKGKVTYFSPEQCKGSKAIDRRSDVFSLGIVLHEMLTGKRLFRRKTDYETMRAILGEDVKPPSQLRPEVSPAIDGIVMTALARDPADRYATAGELSEAIATIAVRDGHALSAGALGTLMHELFGSRSLPSVAFDSNDETAHLVTVSSILAEIDAGAGADAGQAFSGAAEDDLEAIPDTVVQPVPPASIASPDDEWRDEPVLRGELRRDVPALDPRAVIDEVRAVVESRLEAEPTVAVPPRLVERTFDRDPHEARTVAAVPKPSITDPALDIGDRRTAMVVPSVRRAYIAKLVGLAIAVALLVVAAVLALR
jgi:serine/threonine protein kinase